MADQTQVTPPLPAAVAANNQPAPEAQKPYIGRIAGIVGGGLVGGLLGGSAGGIAGGAATCAGGAALTYVGFTAIGDQAGLPRAVSVPIGALASVGTCVLAFPVGATGGAAGGAFLGATGGAAVGYGAGNLIDEDLATPATPNAAPAPQKQRSK